MKIEVPHLWSTAGIEDEVSLAQQLYDTYLGEDRNVAEIVVMNNFGIREFVTKSSTLCGVQRLETIEKFVSEKALLPFESSGRLTPKFDKDHQTNRYSLIIDWPGFIKYVGFLHDQEADEPYGEAKQKQIIKDILLKLDTESQDKELVVSETVLGEYVDHDSTAYFERGDENPDRHIKFMSTLRHLERDGFLKVNKVEFDLTAVPEMVGAEKDWSLSMGDDAYFRPASHCHVYLELLNSNSVEGVLLREAEKTAIPVDKLSKAFEDDAEVKPKEDFYKDEIQFIGKLLKICTPDFLTLEIISPAKLAESDDFRAGFDKDEVFEDLNKRGVFSKIKDIAYKPNPRLIYEVEVDYQKLLQAAGEIHDEIESAGDLYTFEQQKRNLLKIILESIKEEPSIYFNGLTDVSEAWLGAYKPNNDEKPLGISLTRPDLNRPDIRYQFFRAMKSLEKEGNFVIKSIKFDFGAKPRLSIDSQRGKIFGSTEPKTFYPPEHCILSIELKKEPVAKLSENVVVGNSTTDNKVSGDLPKVESEPGKPYCTVEKSIGYLKFGKYGTKRKIGSVKGRPFLFLQSVIDPIGVYKAVDAVFTSIWQEKDKNDSKLIDPTTSHNRKVEIIKNSCIKELQKGNKLNGKIGFEFDTSESKVKAILLD